MALIQCPSCGNQISNKAATCPYCGQPLEPINMPQQQRQTKNNNTLIIVLVAMACLALGALAALLLNKNSNKTETPSELQTTQQTTNPDASASLVPAQASDSEQTTTTEGVPSIPRKTNQTTTAEDVPSIPRNGYSGESIPDALIDYVVISDSGRGVYLRHSPSPEKSARTGIIYYDYTHFMGAPSNVPGWIMVIENGNIIGYMPQEKVYLAEDYSNYAQ